MEFKGKNREKNRKNENDKVLEAKGWKSN